MKYLLCIILVFFSQITKSQDKRTVPSKNLQKGFLAVDFLSIDMPRNDEDDMGFTGIHYNLAFNKFYTGLGMYGSVKGIRGGFFTLGVNAGYKTYLSKRLFLDTGIHFGGGGGAGAPDGGGAFILPHLDLGIQFEKFSFTTGYSHINFFDDGDIKSHQIHFVLQIPVHFSSASTKNVEKEFTTNDLLSSDWNRKPKHTSFMLHLNNLSVKKSGDLIGKIIRLAGFELNSYINNNWFYFAKFDGAYDGIKAGYMDILLGAGYHFSFNKNRTNILTKFGMGAGGGGGVSSQGGFLIYPDLSIEQHITNNTYLSINKGFLMSPNSFFKTSTLGIGLKYYSNINGISEKSKDKKGIFKGVEVIVKQDAYLNAKRISNPTEDLHQISLQLNYHLNKNIYLAGQTSFANFGNAGAYAEGVVGFGVQSNYFFNTKINMFLQSLAGGAGGGNISTGEGLIIKPSMGLNYQVNSSISIRVATGYVKTLVGELSSPFFNLGISYRLAFLTSK
tara:strand:+ start:36649 stop:38154 length:1506 start_codon:yes stop_codon:yes gene_type:complete